MKKFLSTIAVAAVLLTACGSEVESGLAFADVTEFSEAGSAQYPYDSFESLTRLVSERAESDGGMMIITGRITAVDPGASFTWAVEDEEADARGEQRTQLKYGDKESWIDTIHLQVEVDSHIAGPKAPATLTVGVAMNPGIGIDAARKDYGSLDSLVFFLRKSPVFDYEPELWGVIQDGSLMGELDESGTITFPLVDEPEVMQLDPERGIQLDDLVTAASTK